ncbi:MAG: hypothetical protein L0387_40825 [Acidobacteria bacterium]|nr:hypothetical protein [Acidobacteriota bacterium]
MNRRRLGSGIIDFDVGILKEISFSGFLADGLQTLILLEVEIIWSNTYLKRSIKELN